MHDTNQLYRWSITYFGDMEEQENVQKCLDTIAKDYIFQLEKCPTTGNFHFQCFVKLKKKRRCKELCKLLNGMSLKGATCSPAMDTSALSTYCMKENTRVEGPWSNKPIYLGEDLITIDMMYPWQKKILAKIAFRAHDRKIEWYYDPIGGVGKSAISKYLYFHHDIITLTIGKASDVLNLVYKLQGRKMYIFDISRTVTQGTMTELYAAMEAVKNGYFVNTKYDTGVCCMARPHVIVFSNKLPKLSALSQDRWDIFDMSQKSQEN